MLSLAESGMLCRVACVVKAGMVPNSPDGPTVASSL